MLITPATVERNNAYMVPPRHRRILTNDVLNHTSGTQADKADATITLSRDTLNKVILKETKLKEAIDSGNVKIAGSQAKMRLRGDSRRKCR